MFGRRSVCGSGCWPERDAAGRITCVCSDDFVVMSRLRGAPTNSSLIVTLGVLVLAGAVIFGMARDT